MTVRGVGASMFAFRHRQGQVSWSPRSAALPAASRCRRRCGADRTACNRACALRRSRAGRWCG